MSFLSIRTTAALATGLAVILAWTLPTSGCAGPSLAATRRAAVTRPASPQRPSSRTERTVGSTRPPVRDVDPLVGNLEARTFQWFWDQANAANGLVPDRAPVAQPMASIAAVGFALAAYPVGVERRYVTRAEAKDRVRRTLDFFAGLPQGSTATGTAGYHGFFYHFLDMNTGLRYGNSELSTIDTALFIAGALAAAEYFDGADPAEAAIRAQADFLYRRIEWTWAQVRPPAVSHGWYPESGFIPYDWRGYNEAMLLYVLALGSPTFAVAPIAWDEYTSTYRWATFGGQEYLQFGPLFGYHYSHAFIDFRGIKDAYMRAAGADYAEMTRRAAYAHRQYAIDNPGGFAGYDANAWGLTACDGPGEFTATIDGRERTFHSYLARAASERGITDDGTIAPTAAAASLPFAPEIVVPALNAMHQRYGDHVYAQYGFVDSFNPTITAASVPVTHGRTVPGIGWFDADYLGIDQGPIVLMIENHRSGLVWKLLRGNPYVVAGLKSAGFRGGWLDTAR